MDTKKSFFDRLPKWIGGFVIFFCLVVIASWYAHWRDILQLIPHTAPMQFNTALCFILSGAALFLLTTTLKRVAAVLGCTAAIFAALTFLEYLTGLNLHIDLLFYKPYFEEATAYSGRMSPLTAISFVFVGIGLALLNASGKQTRQLAVAGLLMSIVTVIAFVALVGFAFGIESAYGWGADSSMAVNTAALFLMLSIAAMVLSWRMARRENYNLILWLPVTTSATLMAMVAFVAVGDMKGLGAATFWRKHTIQTMLAAATFENDLVNLQRGMRGYVTLGDTNALATFQNEASLEATNLSGLFNLTIDNTVQQQRLQALDASMKRLLSYDAGMIELYRRQGPEAVFEKDSSGQGRLIFGETHDLLKSFEDNEHQLLDVRDVSEEVGYHNTEHLLVFGCVMSGILLLVANYITRRELAKRHRAEARLARQAEALRRSNTELKQFAYVASHDLREPLRAVSGFAQILKEENQAKLDENANQTIDRIVNGAKRMANIINDLLALSSIDSERKPFETEELEKSLEIALENLSVAVSERKAVVRHGQLPAVPVDASQLTLLFQNLIGNAIKFCSGRVPEVQIDATRENGGFWKISVRDNGIGIDPKYFDKIFGIFQRLHARTAYPGTGIGLAICKKIVERHGGRIWLESVPGNGTTFYFTLAEQQPEKDDAN
jgi:signal transduction histidine kinase